MNWDAASAIAEIVGLAAVVISILYLAVQTKLTRQAAQHASMIGVVGAHSKWRWALFENPDLAKVVAKANRGETLSDDEQLQIRNLHMELFVASVLGTYTSDGEAPRAEEHYLLSIMLENPSVVAEWKHHHRFMEMVAPEFTADVDTKLGQQNAT